MLDFKHYSIYLITLTFLQCETYNVQLASLSVNTLNSQHKVSLLKILNKKIEKLKSKY